MDGPYLAAVDIGGTKITVSIANISGILVKLYRPVQLEGDNLAVPAQVDFLVGHACEQIGIERDEITALGVSTCGPFGIRDGELVLVAPNLCGGLANERGIIPNDWTEIPLQRELSRIYNKIHIENDGTIKSTSRTMASRLLLPKGCSVPARARTTSSISPGAQVSVAEPMLTGDSSGVRTAMHHISAISTW